MSDQERNTGRTDDMDFSALDEELAQMAEETPEVPKDFHDNWTKMIREEAAASSPETTAGRPRAGRGQLRYILSAAAAFVVLIGGVVLARNNGLLPGATTPVQEAPALTANTLAAGKASEEAEAVYEDAMAPADQASFLGMSAESMPAPEAAELPEDTADKTAAAKTNGVKASKESVQAAPMPAATASPTEPAVLMMVTGAAEMNVDMDVAESEAAETTAEESETEEAAGETPEKSEEEPAGEPAPETAEDGQGEDTRSFLQKAWEGILDAVPWILGGTIIVLFMLTYVIHPGKKK